MSRLAIECFEAGIKRRKSFVYWRELEQSQWFSYQRLREQQLESLVRLVSHAERHSAFYQSLWRSRGLTSRRLDSHEAFHAWPVIDRDTIREHRLAMRAAVGRAKLIHKATGGSTGVPLQFDLDTDSNDRRMGAWHRGYGWAGAPPGTRQWYLWGGMVGDVSRWTRWKDALYHWLYRRRMANCFYLTQENSREYVDGMNRYRPEAIVAYANPLYTLACQVDRQGWNVHSPRTIVVGAEKLHDFQRELIERVFRAPVFETYGSREFMLIGGECERHTGLHLSMENLLVEVLNEQGEPVPAGEEGEVVITDLTNYGMPFVRYRNGDRAIAGLEMCVCGRGLPLIRKVVGRRLDMLETPDGRQVPGEFLPHLMKEFEQVRRFQLVQHEPTRMEIVLVVGTEWSPIFQQQLERQIREVVGDVVKLEFRHVDDIPLTPAGKLRVVVNHCLERGRTAKVKEA